MSVDIQQCDRDPIHRLGLIQPFGCLLAVDSDWIIRYVSANIVDRVGLEKKPEAWLGQSALSLLSMEAVHTIRGRLQTLSGDDAVDRIFALPLTGDGDASDIAIHRSGRLIVIEWEPSERDTGLDAASTTNAMITRLKTAADQDAFFDEAVRRVRAVTGFDRVMIYRFDPTGAGEVIAETRRHDLEPYLGLRYPASDIPKQARELYRRNLLRIISDVDAEPAPLVGAGGDETLDLSMSILRAVSPVHLDYLRNMGVASSMSVSIVQEGRLWGLIACHHMAPRHISYERRTTIELFAQMFSLLMERQEREDVNQKETRAREIHDRLLDLMAGTPSGNRVLKDFLGDIGSTIECDGAALWIENELITEGDAPDYPELEKLVLTLNDISGRDLIVTHRLSDLHPPAADYETGIAGMIAIPVSRAPSDYLLLFRRELIKKVTWAGKSEKAVASDAAGRLSPRRSFAAWRDEVRGEAEHWTPAELRLAERYRATVLEVILRFSDVAKSERKRTQERQELLIAELNHRVRNILTLIRGLIKQSDGSASSLKQFTLMLGGRIEALARRAHDQITTDQWDAAPLHSMIDAEAKAFLLEKSDHVVMEGPPVLLEPQAFSTLALVIHELITNAAKYGALCDSSGRVHVNWSLDDDSNVRLSWIEEGGPPVQAPSRRGFGSTIIEHSIPFDLKGSAVVDYALSGVKVELMIPADYVRLVDPDKISRRPKEQGDAADREPVTLVGHALLVEDTMIVALDTEDMLIALGASTVDVASSAKDAFRLIKTTRPAYALLDINLGGETSFPVAGKLIEEGIPFVFATGYGDDVALPEAYREVPIVKKPYNAETVLAQLTQAMRGKAKLAQDGGAGAGSSLTASPD